MKKLIFSFIITILVIPNIGLATNPPVDACDDNYPIPTITADINTNNIVLSWDEINHGNLSGYKVVISKNDSTPVYPTNGYLAWITDTSNTSYVVDNSSSYHNGDFDSYLEEGEDYYFSVTAVYGCGEKVAGNVLNLIYPGDSVNPISYPLPEITASYDPEEGVFGILLEWEMIDHSQFNGYKIVISKNDSTPEYPANGYLKYITDPTTTGYLINNSRAYHNGDFGSYLEEGEDYYFSVTALYGSEVKVPGNVLHLTYQKNDTDDDNPDPRPQVDPLIEMRNNAERLLNSELGDILAELQELRDKVREQANEIKYLRSLVTDINSVAQSVRDTLNQFITYGVDQNTEKMGAGERASVIHSYKAAYGKLPESENEITDVIKIANGRWPSKISTSSENKAKLAFKKIYLRDSNMSDSNDNAAITLMAYGLKQKAENRNLDSEREGIKTFKYIYGYLPNTTEEWNVMQAITYSGATR